MDDARAEAQAHAAGPERMLFVVHEEGELALQDVEGVCVAPVEVRACSGPRACRTAIP